MKLDLKTLTNSETLDMAFDILHRNINMTISTIDSEGNPNSRIVNVFHRDEEDLYFITFEEKPFFQELKRNNTISMNVMNDESVQVRVKANIHVLDCEEEKEFKTKYPDRVGRLVNPNVRLIKLKDGVGEIFDLSGDLSFLQRTRFSFGNRKVNQSGYIINENCNTCGSCIEACPFDSISKGKDIYIVNQHRCNECGICIKVCPVDAITVSIGL